MTHTDRDDHMTESERADIDREHMLLWVDEVASGETPLLSVPGHWRFDPLFQDELARKLGLGSTVLQYVKLKALEDVLLKRLEQAGKKSCTCQVSANTVRHVTIKKKYDASTRLTFILLCAIIVLLVLVIGVLFATQS